MPQIVFSFPEAASVGLTVEQAQAREDLIEIKETNYPMLANARMLMSGTAGSLTIVSGCDAANPDTPRVLGVHMVSQMASDIIAEAEQLVGNHVPVSYTHLDVYKRQVPALPGSRTCQKAAICGARPFLPSSTSSAPACMDSALPTAAMPWASGLMRRITSPVQ